MLVASWWSQVQRHERSMRHSPKRWCSLSSTSSLVRYWTTQSELVLPCEERWKASGVHDAKQRSGCSASRPPTRHLPLSLAVGASAEVLISSGIPFSLRVSALAAAEPSTWRVVPGWAIRCIFLCGCRRRTGPDRDQRHRAQLPSARRINELVCRRTDVLAADWCGVGFSSRCDRFPDRGDIPFDPGIHLDHGHAGGRALPSVSGTLCARWPTPTECHFGARYWPHGGHRLVGCQAERSTSPRVVRNLTTTHQPPNWEAKGSYPALCVPITGKRVTGRRADAGSRSGRRARSTPPPPAWPPRRPPQQSPVPRPPRPPGRNRPRGRRR